CSLMRSTLVAKAFLSTSKVTGSSVEALSVGAVVVMGLSSQCALRRAAGGGFGGCAAGGRRQADPDVEPFVDDVGCFGWDHGGRIDLIEDRRSDGRRSGGQVLPLVDGRAMPRSVEVDIADLDRLAGIVGADRRGFEAGLRGLAQCLEMELVDLDRRLILPECVMLLVLLVEELHGVFQSVRSASHLHLQ